MLNTHKRAEVETRIGRELQVLADVPGEDAGVYDMLSRADSVGVFQVESRAQMSMLPRMKPREFYDLVIEVAIVRPGPIQGNMVHPYLRRREGLEPVHFPSPSPEHGPSNELEQVLRKTLGVPLFQEQAMRLAIVAAKFTPEEANGLRRTMATFRHYGDVGVYSEKFIEGMVRRGYERDFAQRCFSQIEGFGSYGFPESHAASFGKLVYVSAWIKHHHPDVFCAALLNSQPMGFYQPAQLVRDAREHDVEVRGPDVLHSDWDCTLEPPGPSSADPRLHAVRLGFRQIKGLAQVEIERLIAARTAGARGFDALLRQARLSRGALDKLAEADAFRSLGMDRRAALWAVRGLAAEATGSHAPLAEAAGLPPERQISLPGMELHEHVAEDYRTTSLSLKAHPVSFFRPELDAGGVTRACDLQGARFRTGRRVAVAGLVLIRQRPGTAKGVTFVTLEDETGVTNLVIWQNVFQAQRKTWMTASFLRVQGRLQKENGVTHIVAERVEDLSADLGRLREDGPVPRVRTEAQGRLLRSRDFH
jgi:error-prone DNA polymerase